MVSRIPGFLAGRLWISTTAYRLLRISIYRVQAQIKSQEEEYRVARLDVNLLRPVSISPGSYFYVFPDGSIFKYSFRSYPLIVAWHKPDEVVSRRGKVKTTKLVFLVSHQLRSLFFSQGQHLLLDGPYSRDLGLERFKKVILTAKGIGIAGILPLALGLAERKKHDGAVKGGPGVTLFRDIARRVDLFWVLENNAQFQWLAGELAALQVLDPGNVSTLLLIHP